MGQFSRYIITGGIAALADITLFNLCIHAAGVNHILSNTLSFTSGLVVNYFLSRKWVFNKKAHDIKKDFTLFSLVGIAGLALGNILMLCLVDTGLLRIITGLADSGAIKSLAKIIIIFPVLLWNFAARKKLVFST